MDHDESMFIPDYEEEEEEEPACQTARVPCPVEGCVYQGSKVGVRRHWGRTHRSHLRLLGCAFCGAKQKAETDLWRHVRQKHQVGQREVVALQSCGVRVAQVCPNRSYVPPGPGPPLVGKAEPQPGDRPFKARDSVRAVWTTTMEVIQVSEPAVTPVFDSAMAPVRASSAAPARASSIVQPSAEAAPSSATVRALVVPAPSTASEPTAVVSTAAATSSTCAELETLRKERDELRKQLEQEQIRLGEERARVQRRDLEIGRLQRKRAKIVTVGDLHQQRFAKPLLIVPQSGYPAVYTVEKQDLARFNVVGREPLCSFHKV